jgi:glycerol uptake facilitator-like aquaporin
MTFLLVVTVYSVAVGEPSFGIMGPLVIGAALYAAALTGGGFTGAALNPARVLGMSLTHRRLQGRECGKGTWRDREGDI